MKKFTPLQIEWALVFYWSADPIASLGARRGSSTSGLAAAEWLEREGLIEKGEGDIWQRTDRLVAYVEHLCAQPLPVSKYVQPEPE